MPSNHIQGISYDPEELLLTVQFRKSTYVYKGVPEDIATGFENALSAGSYLNEMIKPTYEFERVS